MQDANIFRPKSQVPRLREVGYSGQLGGVSILPRRMSEGGVTAFEGAIASGSAERRITARTKHRSVLDDRHPPQTSDSTLRAVQTGCSRRRQGAGQGASNAPKPGCESASSDPANGGPAQPPRRRSPVFSGLFFARRPLRSLRSYLYCRLPPRLLGVSLSLFLSTQAAPSSPGRVLTPVALNKVDVAVCATHHHFL